MCTTVFIGSLSQIRGRYRSAKNDRRHLFVTPGRESKNQWVTVNSKEENSSDFCPNYVQEIGLWVSKLNLNVVCCSYEYKTRPCHASYRVSTVNIQTPNWSQLCGYARDVHFCTVCLLYVHSIYIAQCTYMTALCYQNK